MEMTTWNEIDKAVQEGKKRETIKALSNVTTVYSSKAKAPLSLLGFCFGVGLFTVST